MMRRRLIVFSLAAAATGLAPPLAGAQSAPAATQFVQRAGQELADIVNAPGSEAEKRPRLQAVVDRIVDVPAVAQFCLGRFWRQASPQQQQEYVGLFHQVLLNSITGHLGAYKGVAFTMTTTQPRDAGTFGVGTTITRPGAAAANVEWIVANTAAGPKIVDVVAEGTSLRLTQRSDYASYLSQHGNRIQALLDAMRRQVSGAG